MKDCKLNCDFGYIIRDNCETCRCNCVNEDNYFKEIRKSFQLENTRVKSTQFCKKSCILGYTKDDFGCFKCSCIEDLLASQTKSQPPQTSTTTTLTTTTLTATKEPTCYVILLTTILNNLFKVRLIQSDIEYFRFIMFQSYSPVIDIVVKQSII